MTQAAPISRSVLSDQVKDRVLEAILVGTYPPGARIVETRVAQELGTSQAPVREALRDLEALGLVEITAFRGARVRRPSADELLEAYVIRAELESMAARLAVPRLAEGDVEALAADVEAMRAAAAVDDRHAEALADARFHGRILEASGNRTLVRVWQTLEPFSRTYLSVLVPSTDPRPVADRHLPILRALEARDADAASEALRVHFADVAADLARTWADGPGGDAPATLTASRAAIAGSPDRRTG